MIIVVPQEIRGAVVGTLVTAWLLPLVQVAAAPPADVAAPTLEDKFGSNPLPTPLFWLELNL